MEKDILAKLKALEKEGRSRLAAIRRAKREARPKQNHTLVMSEFLQARKSEAVDESYLLNKYLDKDDLTVKERHSLTNRRRTVLRKKQVGS
jgi:hypothetical protein